MTASRFASLSLLALLAAAGCGESRGTNPTTASVTIPGPNGDANGAVTVDAALCGRCHGDVARVPTATDSAGIQFAPPKDVAGATTGAKVGDHQGHLKAGPLRGAGVPCAACHAIPQGAMQHVPGVQFRGLAATSWTGTISPTPSYDAGTGTCANTYCHGNFPGGKAASITWTSTAALGCSTCHGFGPRSPEDPAHPTSNACGDCHPDYLAASPDLSTHIDGKLDVSCTKCHGTAGRTPNTIPGVAATAFDAHLDASPPLDALQSSTGITVGAHLAHVDPTASTAAGAQPTGGVYKPILCSECHPSFASATHNNGTANVTFVSATGAKINNFNATETPSSGGTAATCSTYCHNGVGGGSVTTWSWTGAAATCGSCHGFPPASHAASLTTAAQCSGCHADTVNTDGTINIAGGFHINGTVEGGGEPTSPGASCSGCHSAIYAGMTGAATSKHTLGSADPAFQTGLTWGSPLSGNVAGDRTCTNMCHDDHPHDADGTTHAYNVYADANARATAKSTTTRAKTDFDATATNGGLCVSCHTSPILASGPVVTKATYAASAHNRIATSDGTNTYAWQYALHSGTFDRNCTKCHASTTEGRTPAASGTGTAAVHSNTNPTLLAGATTPIAGNMCFNCHGSGPGTTTGSQGNRSGKDLQTPFAKASTHNPAGSCVDCHAPHAAGSVLHTAGTNAIAASSPLNGASGVTYTPPAGNWPATVTGLAATATASKEYEVCFKCHTSSPPAGLTNVAQEFSTNNHSVHPVVGPNTFWPINNPTRRLGGQWTAGVGKTMYCSDCHGSETTAGAQGPHGSAAAFILKGNGTARTYWPTDASGSYYQLGGTVTGLFCLNCHPNLNSTAGTAGPPADWYSNTLHRNGNHRNQGFACIDCHLRVPHGGKVPRLLITNTGDMASGAANPSPLKDPNAWQTTGRTPAYPGDTPPSAWARPTTTTNDMGTSNCTACSQHTCSSGTCEAW